MGRRRFLGLAGGASLATAAAGATTVWLRPGAALAAGSGAAAAGSTGSTLVHVFLRGGADGLSVLAPVDDPLYHQSRPTIAVPGDAGLPAAEGFALHPAATRLKAMFDAGRLALVPAAGSPNPVRSHFSAQDLMEKGTPSTMSTPDGWLGRYVRESAGANEATLRSLSIGKGVQPSLRGSATIAARDLSSLAVPAGPPAPAVAGLYVGGPGPLADQAGAARDVVADVAPLQSEAAPPAGWPTGFGPAFWPIARLLTAGAPVEVASVDLGGWDLHHDLGSATDDKGAMHRLVADLDAALGAFFDHLGPLGDAVTVVGVTEFGRRIAENGSGGADHGRGSVMLVAGGGVDGGVKGDWPGLADTDAGDVRVVNDYRLVMAELLGRRLRPADLTRVFPDVDVSPSRWLGVTRTT